MNIVIIGSGAMGLLFYHQLSGQHHVSMTLKDKRNTQSTYCFSNLLGFSTEHPLTVASEKELAQADVIITTVKAYDVVSALSGLSIPAQTPLLLMHNGMGTLEQVSSMLPNPILQMLTTQASKKLAPFHILHTGQGTTQIGSFVSEDLTLGQDIFSNLQGSIPNLECSEQIQQLQWNKLAVNCVINPLTAIYNVNNGELAKSQYRQYINQVLDELIQVATCEGITLDKAALSDIVYAVINNTQRNSSSMRQDILHQRKTEIGYINGYVAKLGEKHHIPTPVNTNLFEQVVALEVN